MNKVFLIGYLGNNPEQIESDKATIVKFNLATSRGKNENKHTEWHRIIAFYNTAKLIKQYLNKGDLIFLEGTIHYSNYEKNGNKMYSTEIICNTFRILKSSSFKNNKENLIEAETTEATEAIEYDDDEDIPF